MPTGTGWPSTRTADPWIAGCNGDVFHLDAQTNTVQSVDVAEGCLRGLAIDRDGQGWVAANGPCRLVQFDTATESIVDDDIELPQCQLPVGVAVDVEGYVWVVDFWGSKAFKVDPATHDVVLTNVTVDSPYTYSDMTGAGLSLVYAPPAG